MSVNDHRFSPLISLLIALFHLCSWSLFSQDAILNVHPMSQPVHIDGEIDSQWAPADSILLDFQLEPKSGSHPTRDTYVKAAQYKDEICFLFICHIRHTKEISAGIQTRDRLTFNDDLISILMDTYNDNRTAVLFQVNPLGTLTDVKITNDGKSKDYLWDTEWEASARVYSQYWIVEIKIPLKSIQFNPKTKDWGINFSRSFRENQEINWWRPVTENFRVSQSGRLCGLKLSAGNKSRLEVFPYSTLRYENSDITGNYRKLKADAGLDIKYKYSSNLNANLALNPDFATVEGDKEQINLTPYELKFPEKRLFFQDGNELFDTRIQTFYSRRIGDIQLGGKLHGKVGKYKFNGLYARTKEDSETGIPSAHFNAIRVKRDFLKSSSLGFAYTDKITDSLNFHTFSADYILNLGNNWKLTGQLVSSLPGDLESHSAWFTRFARENNTYHYHVRFTSIGENFRENVNETGFITDDDRREIDSDVSYKFWFEKFARYIKVSGKNNIFWSQSGILRSWYLTYGSRIYFTNKLSLDLYYNNEYKNNYHNTPDDYFNYYYRGIAGYNTDESNSASASFRKGVNFKRNFDLLELNTSLQLLKKLSLNYEFKYLNFTPDPENESTVLNILGLSYYQTKDLWFRVFTQHNSKDNRFYLYGLAGWRFKPPFGALYLIYSSDHYQVLLSEDEIMSKILFLKLTYPITIKR